MSNKMENAVDSGAYNEIMDFLMCAYSLAVMLGDRELVYFVMMAKHIVNERCENPDSVAENVLGAAEGTIH